MIYIPTPTITGVSTANDLINLATLYRGYREGFLPARLGLPEGALGPPPFEIGILYSNGRAGTEKRFPTLKWIHEHAEWINATRTALHICGKDTFRMFEEKHEDLMEILPLFQRIQLNGVPADKVAALAPQFPDHFLIAQARNVIELRMICSQLRPEQLINDPRPNWGLLLDGSGGRGKAGNFSSTQCAALECEEVRAFLWAERIGFSGGLGADNLAFEIGRLQAVAAPFWTDMEGNLRNGDDELDLGSALGAVRSVMDLVAGCYERQQPFTFGGRKKDFHDMGDPRASVVKTRDEIDLPEG